MRALNLGSIVSAGLFAFVALSAVAACGGETAGGAQPQAGTNLDNPSPDAGDSDSAVASDASTDDAAIDAGVDTGPNRCVGTFGSALTQSFGRIDGTLYAIVTPADQQCPKPNSDHVSLEIMMNGAVYRLLINVQSDQTGSDPNVQFAEKDVAVPGGPWTEGWHTSGFLMDYARTLGAHAADFSELPKDALVQKVVSEVTIGDRISVFATGYGPDGGHNIHRNGANNDGAVVVHPESATPHVLMFHFADQTF